MATHKSAFILVCVLGFTCAASISAHAQTTFLAIGSDPGDVIGSGQNVYLDEGTATFTSSQGGGAGRHWYSATVQPTGGGDTWHIGLSFSTRLPFTLGQTYQTIPNDPLSPSIGVYAGSSPPCTAQSGRFTLRETGLYTTSLGLGVVLDLDFEVKCSGASAGLYGQLRLKSTGVGLNVGTLEMSATSPVAPGTPLRFAVGMDANVPLEFKFIRYRAATATWEVVQDYSFRPEWAWTPTAADLGDYAMQVWVRARGSNNPHDTWRSFGPFTISASPPEIVSVTPEPAGSVAAGTTVVWTVIARGGTAALEFQFVRYAPALGGWQIVRDWSPDPVWMQRTTPVDEGENIVVALVRSGSAGGAAAMGEGRAAITRMQEPYALATRVFDGALPPVEQTFYGGPGGGASATTGDGLTVFALAPIQRTLGVTLKTPGGGVPAVGKYEHAQRDPDPIAGLPGLTASSCSSTITGTFRVLELEGSDTTTPTRVAADIQQHCEGEATDLFVAVRINSTLPLFTMYEVTSNAPSIVGPGTTVTWKADASSGTGPVEYRFIRYSMQQGTWTLVRDWNRDPSFTWTTTAADYGSYRLQVWARTAGTAVAYEDWRNADLLNVIPMPVSVYGVLWDVSQARAGEPVTLEAIAGGGSGDLEYRFVRFDRAIGQWSVIREYAASNRVDWTPPVGTAGVSDVQVWVREAGSTSAYDAWGHTELSLGAPRLLVIAGRPADPISNGRAVTLPLADAVASSGLIAGAAIDTDGVWRVDFRPVRGPWATGVVEDANQPPNMSSPGVWVAHGDSVCANPTGRFTVNQLTFDAAGTPNSASIDFEQYCDGAAEPLYGGLRYNSDIPLVYALSVTPSSMTTTVGGHVTFTGIGSSATGPVEYRFVILNQENGQWSLIHDYQTANSVDWIAPAPGTYITQVWVRRQRSAAAYESYVNGVPVTVR